MRLFGLSGVSQITAGELWLRIGKELDLREERWSKAWEILLERGTLSRRISRSLGPHPDLARFAAVYGELCDCLSQGRMFLGSQ